jgi:DNA-binding XRE family transcriptional regulator
MVNAVSAKLKLKDCTILKTVVSNMKRLRLSRGMSCDKLAYEAGVCRSSYGYYERLCKLPNIETLSKIAQALQVHVSVLFIDFQHTSIYKP